MLRAGIGRRVIAARADNASRKCTKRDDDDDDSGVSHATIRRATAKPSFARHRRGAARQRFLYVREWWEGTRKVDG